MASRDREHSEVRIVCPHCGEKSTAIKQTRIPLLIFLVIAASASATTFIGCPTCTKTALLKKLAINVVTAHLMFPIMAILYLVLYLQTRGRGHSKAIRKLLSLEESSRSQPR